MLPSGDLNFGFLLNVKRRNYNQISPAPYLMLDLCFVSCHPFHHSTVCRSVCHMLKNPITCVAVLYCYQAFPWPWKRVRCACLPCAECGGECPTVKPPAVISKALLAQHCSCIVLSPIANAELAVQAGPYCFAVRYIRCRIHWNTLLYKVYLRFNWPLTVFKLEKRPATS